MNYITKNEHYDTKNYARNVETQSSEVNFGKLNCFFVHFPFFTCHIPSLRNLPEILYTVDTNSGAAWQKLIFSQPPSHS